jgi:hypothetical protein
LVPLAGIEPALLAELDFESSASTNSATGATRSIVYSVSGGAVNPRKRRICDCDAVDKPAGRCVEHDPVWRIGYPPVVLTHFLLKSRSRPLRKMLQITVFFGGIANGQIT